jgi:hypothetical protein
MAMFVPIAAILTLTQKGVQGVAGTTPFPAADVVHLRVTRVPHLNADTPLKPNNMDMASFDKAGKVSVLMCGK